MKSRIKILGDEIIKDLEERLTQNPSEIYCSNLLQSSYDYATAKLNPVLSDRIMRLALLHNIDLNDNLSTQNLTDVTSLPADLKKSIYIHSAIVIASSRYVRDVENLRYCINSKKKNQEQE